MMIHELMDDLVDIYTPCDRVYPALKAVSQGRGIIHSLLVTTLQDEVYRVPESVEPRFTDENNAKCL